METTTGALCMLCAFFALLLIAVLQSSPQWRRGPAAKPALYMMFFVFIMLLSESVGFLWLRGNAAMFSIAAVINAVSSYLAEWFFGMFIVVQVRIDASKKRTVLLALGAFCLVGSVMDIVNGFRPFFYDYSNMQYLSGGGYWVFSILNYALFIFTGILLFFKGGGARRDRIIPVLSQLLPITALFWDSLIPGLYSSAILSFIAIAANYVHLMFITAETAEQKIGQLELKRVRATLERIKPHYIYNVLTSIYYLCDQDTDTAKTAIRTFSDYLRGVLNGMETPSLVPLSQELSTVRNYLELEKMRFGDEIRVRYAIGAEDFPVPPFSLQPLVENAVKHGLEQSRADGEIVISAVALPDGYEVSVRDTYGGFDPGQADVGGSGTNYVREILALTVNGTLQIRSAPGEGTTAVVSIPLQKETGKRSAAAKEP